MIKLTFKLSILVGFLVDDYRVALDVSSSTKVKWFGGCVKDAYAAGGLGMGHIPPANMIPSINPTPIGFTCTFTFTRGGYGEKCWSFHRRSNVDGLAPIAALLGSLPKNVLIHPPASFPFTDVPLTSPADRSSSYGPSPELHRRVSWSPVPYGFPQPTERRRLMTIACLCRAVFAQPDATITVAPNRPVFTVTPIS